MNNENEQAIHLQGFRPDSELEAEVQGAPLCEHVNKDLLKHFYADTRLKVEYTGAVYEIKAPWGVIAVCNSADTMMVTLLGVVETLDKIADLALEQSDKVHEHFPVEIITAAKLDRFAYELMRTCALSIINNVSGKKLMEFNGCRDEGAVKSFVDKVGEALENGASSLLSKLCRNKE